MGGTSIYTGVSFHPARNKFVAACTYNGKKKYLGGFETALEASQAYNKYLKTIL